MDKDEKEIREAEKSSTLAKNIVELVIELVIVALLVFLFNRFVAFRSVVNGSSMNPALEDGNNLIVERVSYYFHNPERYDIVVFHSPIADDSKEYYIKRVIAIQGETVEIIDGEVYIDGNLLETDTYGREKMKVLSDGSLLNYGPVVVPQDRVFVLGDNRNNSRDSRYADIGTVDRNLILGRVVFRFWPLSELEHFK